MQLSKPLRENTLNVELKALPNISQFPKFVWQSLKMCWVMCGKLTPDRIIVKKNKIKKMTSCVPVSSFSLLITKKVRENYPWVEISSPFCMIERDQKCVEHQRHPVIQWKRIKLLFERDNNRPSFCILAKSNRSEGCRRLANLKTKKKKNTRFW